MLPPYGGRGIISVASESSQKVREFDLMPLKLALQYDGVRERERERGGLNARFQTAFNLSVDFNRNFVLKLSSLYERV